VDNASVDQVKNFIIIFTSIFYEALPFIVLGAVIAGILQEFLPARLVTRILPANRTVAVALGGLLGLIFPMCECGIIPIMRRLLRKGLPLSCCMAYLLAGPIINAVVILSTVVAFSGVDPNDPLYRGQMTSAWMTGLRVGMGYVVALVVALLVERQYQKHGKALLKPLPVRGDDEEDDQPGVKKTPLKRLGNISETALHDFIDIAVFLIIGALLAATSRMFIRNEDIPAFLASVPVSAWLVPVAAIVVMMVFAVLVTLCSEADAFVAASFSTLPPASKLAFLVLGPMLDLKLIVMYTRVFRPPLIRTIITAVVLQVLVYSCIVHFVWERFGPH
jgi:uncharacterized membrane protein YraQ (UPF0718 family)